MASRYGSGRSIWLAGALGCLLALCLAPLASAAYTPATERIADDFRRDSALSACDHEPGALQAARAEVAADRTQGVPGLLGAIDAALAARNGGACGDDDGGQDPDPADDDDGGGAAATATPAPGEPGASPTPAPEPAAGDGTATPAPVPTVPGGEAAPAPAPQPAASTPAPAPDRAATADEDLPVSVWILAGAALLLALLALLSVLLSRGRRGDEPLARMGHMWREAGYRFGSAWSDFSEWLRVGR